jgi:hypothetical protein
MDVLASVTRPDEWDFPLFIHVLSALTLIGAVGLALTLLVSSWRAGSATTMRTAYRAIVWGAIPAWVVMRLSAEWIADKEGWNDLDEPPNWIDIGYMTAEPTLILLIIAGVIARVRSKRGDGASVGARIATGLVGLCLVAYLIALWAMTTKPG